MDMGTVLDGRRAVKEKLIDAAGGAGESPPLSQTSWARVAAQEQRKIIFCVCRSAERSKRLFTRGAGSVPFSSTKTTLWFAIFAPLRGTIVESIIVSMGSWGTE